MTKDDNINVKLEVCKDKTSGKLKIMAHFDQNAPNIIKDNDNYTWMPTPEEAAFINEAYQVFSIDTTYPPHQETTPKPEKIEDIQPTQEIEPEKIGYTPPKQETEPKKFEYTPPKQELEPEKIGYTSPQQEMEPKKEEAKKPIEPPSLNKQPDIFEVTTDDIKSDTFAEETHIPIKDTKKEPIEKIGEEPKFDIKKEPTKEVEAVVEEEPKDKDIDIDKGFIVEADAEAINAALKKHTEDEKLVQADEQTIVDRVLSQKKKGKWNKK